MPVSEKQFSGVMNLDDNNDVLPSPHHKDAKNIVFRGNGNTQIAQSVVGNRLIANTLPAGTNSCIGHYYDQLNNRIFYFNYNSNNNHGIYIYNTVSKTISTLFVSGTHSSGDVLNFTITEPITSINIIYGDAYNSVLDTEGDVLYWVDSLGRPSKINIDRKLAAVYASYKRSYLDVAKAPPSMPIKCTYEYDNNVTNNNLRNSLFQFIYRWVYDDGEKSVWSTGSMVPLPWLPYNEPTSRFSNSNSRINAFMSTGDETIRKIEFAVRRCADGVTSDYGLVTSFNKKDPSLAIPNNSVYSYLFYNSTSLVPIDQAEQVLLYDYVPQKAKAQELLNGNTIIYGGITEGYDNISSISASISSNTVTQDIIEVPGTLFFAQQNGLSSYGGTNSVDVFLTGSGGNDVITNVPTNLPSSWYGDFYVKVRNSIGVLSTIFFDSNSATNTIAVILAGLQADAISKGFTATVSGNKLTISSLATINLESAYMTNSLSAIPFDTSKQDGSIYAHQGNSNYRYGIIYYDDKGRTNGTVTSDGLRVTTPKWTGSTLYPFLQMSISHQPPIWASYYHIARTENLTYDKNLFWVSNRAFTKFTTRGSSPTDYSISYIGIGNMSQYNEDIQSSSGYIGYDYSPGDRIRFTERISSTGTVIPLADNLDYEIIGLEANPNVNGYVAQGNYIKIKYPTASVSANFELLEPDPVYYAGTAVNVENFQNYKIQIYSYKKPAGGSDVYYEIGQQYSISQPGTASRYHVGQSQSQDVSLPALIYLLSGDEFFRYRNIPIGANYSFAAGPYTQNDGSGFAGQFSTVIINVWDSTNAPKTISTTNYDIKSQVVPASTCSLVSTDYPNNLTADYLFYNKSASSMTVRVRGTLKASTITAKNQYVVLHAKIVNASGATIKTIISRGTISTTNNEYEFPFDANISVPTLSKLFLITECQAAGSNSLLVGAFGIQLDIVNNTQIALIEKSFSDVYRLEFNSESRASIYDENAKQSFYPTLVRYSLPRNAGTLINQTNRFFPANMDEYDRQKGAIQRFKTRGSQLRVFQNRGVGVAGVLENMIFNADGGENLIQTNKIINQIHYYQGEYGIGNLSTSLASSSNADYFVDPIRGYQVRLSQDGFTAISELYKAQYYITELSNKYTSNKAGTLGGYAKVLGTYNYFEEEYVSVFQGYTGQPNTTLAFNEYRNCYTGFYDYAPEAITSVENSTITFKNGGLYLHDNTSNYATFYGTQYPASVTFVFNEQGLMKKDFNAISLDSYPSAWTSASTSDIVTSLGQNSNLVSSDYESYEGFYHAGLMRDSNSLGGVINGDYLKGAWMQIKLSNTSNNLVYLSGLYMNYTPSQRNF
jgi:hypothetical protein